ncbi:SpaA isopeptide-forming pilin-related protein [Bifidobacterium vansinderenii]|uniref:Cna protein B-type domain-containing protein n=1 Tax=Bifidobacterium vansinderenii TaxID=1984871 RepID=A0A229VW37_9BIFI|nr:SpaA isopeptide-forming pilin-related protein [Bifidobacterium vansinderenii]OXM99745.1 Cna protein B-type domain-containing protein [Bifidobacterium vansinderenii]
MLGSLAAVDTASAATSSESSSASSASTTSPSAASSASTDAVPSATAGATSDDSAKSGSTDAKTSGESASTDAKSDSQSSNSASPNADASSGNASADADHSQSTDGGANSDAASASGTDAQTTQSDDSQSSDEADSQSADSADSAAASSSATDADLIDCTTVADYQSKLHCKRPATAVDNSIFDKHIVTEDVENPSGTTTNLFDYWWDAEDASDGQYRAIDGAYPYWTGSINNGHQLHFNREAHKDPSYPYSQDQYKLHNSWMAPAGKSYGPYRSGMVYNTLVDGYPKLKKDDSADHNVTGLVRDESLSYLFDTSAQDGKRSYTGVRGLFQLIDGYYTYNSQQNFASYDKTSNSFRLYDAKAVMSGNNTAPGQFFPLNTAAEVFKTTDNGTKPVTDSDGHLVYDGSVTSRDPRLNHYLGLTMSSRFVQKNGGHTVVDPTTPVTYEFSGDDDVWVFIDDVLVGDLGGIHDSSSLKIDFSTGKIERAVLNNKNQVVSPVETTTLREAFAAADRLGSTSWDGDKFADNTYHTLKFYYMERGWTDSDMSLRFNLVTAPESNVIKIDQEGNAVPGAGFTLYASDDKYSKKDEVVAAGTTDDNGHLNLVDPSDGEPVFMDVIAQEHGNHFILSETTVPDGYRKAGDMHLLYQTNPSPVGSASDSGVLVSDPSTSSSDGNAWDTGSLAMAQVQVSAPDESNLYYTDKSGKKHHLDADKVKDGTLFAVVFQKDANDKWRGIYGDQIDGWKTTAAESQGGDSDMKAVMEAFQNSPHKFRLSSSGSYDVMLEDLPGDIRDYYYWNGDENAAKYSVGYYWSKSDTNAGVNANNTYLLENTDETDTNSDSAFKRTFAVMLYVSNIRNTVSVQKVDQDETPLNGAEFRIYRKDGDCSATASADGKTSAVQMVQNTCTPVDSLTTADHTKSGSAKDVNAAGVTEPRFNGSGTFPNSAGVKLSGGSTSDGNDASVTYYIVETKAPKGYTASDKVVEVVINQWGVFVNAGEKDDGVKVVRGVGNLVKTMNTYGSSPTVDSTLTWLRMTPHLYTKTDDDKAEDTSLTDVQTARVADGAVKTTGAAKDTTIGVTYGSVADGNVVQEYGPQTGDGNLVYVADTGYLMPSTTQDAAPKGAEKSVGRVELGDKRLSSLVTGSAMVQVADTPEPTTATAAVRKTVDGLEPTWPEGVSFKFRLDASEVETKGAGAAPLPTGGAGTSEAPVDVCVKPSVELGDAGAGAAAGSSDGGSAATSCTVTISKPGANGGDKGNGLVNSDTFGTFSFNWNDIKGVKADGEGVRTVTYSYIVQELGAGADSSGAGGGSGDGEAGSGGTKNMIRYSKAKYQLDITVTYKAGEGLKATPKLTRLLNDSGNEPGLLGGGVEVKADSEGKWNGVLVSDFTNTHTVNVSTLPLTGGRTARDWLLLGAALALAGALGGGTYRLWKRRQDAQLGGAL